MAEDMLFGDDVVGQGAVAVQVVGGEVGDHGGGGAIALRTQVFELEGGKLQQ